MADYTSIKQLATRCGVTHRTASNWLKHPKFPLQREAPWSEDDAKEIVVWRNTVLQPNRADPKYQGRTQEPPRDEQDKDYWLMRKYRAQALQQEGKLLDTDAVMAAWVRTLTDLREQMLMVPASAQSLLGISDDQTGQLNDFIRQTLDKSADYMGDLADASRFIPSGVEGDAPAEAAEAQRVGGESSVHAKVDDGGAGAVEE